MADCADGSLPVNEVHPWPKALAWARQFSFADRAELVAKIVTTLATLWFALALCWGVLGRIGAGHASVVAARGIIAENMATWHIWGPVREYSFTRPPPSAYYVHHPWGTFWLIGLFAKVLGRHPWVPRLAAIACSVSTPPLLYGVGRSVWGPTPGALAALAYVVLPITLSFGDFPGFEVPLVFGVLLATWGYLRFAAGWKRRWAIVSLAGVLWTANTDWEGCIFLGVVLGALLVAHLVLPPRWFGRVNLRRFSAWWAWAVVFVAATLFGYLLYFYKIGAIDSLLAGADKRTAGNDVPLETVLDARRLWIDASFTPVGIVIGKIAAPVFLARLLLGRRVHEIFPLAILTMAAVEYVSFKQAADVHVYWPYPFAPYFALSVGVLAASLLELARFVLARLGREQARDLVPLFVLAIIGALLLGIVPDGIAGERYARYTGGRLDDKGRLNFREIDKAQALEWMSQTMDAGTAVGLHTSMHWTWSQDWALHRPIIGQDRVPIPGQESPRYFVGDLAFMSGSDQRELAQRFHVTVVGQYVLADRTEPAAPVDAFVFDEREPNLLQRYFVSNLDLLRTIRRDPWQTWEFREDWDQKPNPPPTAIASGFREMRIAHNIAVASGDTVQAQQLRSRLVAELDQSAAIDFDDGTKLLGTRYLYGVEPSLELVFVAAGPARDDLQFEIEALVTQKRRFSLVPLNPKGKKVGMPFVVPPKLWKPGFLYVERSPIFHRQGVEAFIGRFTGPNDKAPRPVDRSDWIGLLTLR